MNYDGPRWVCKCGACDVLIEYLGDSVAKCRICKDEFKANKINNLDKSSKPN